MHRRHFLTASLVAMALVVAFAGFSATSRNRKREKDLTGSAPVATPGGVLSGNPAIQLIKIADGLADPVAVAAPDDGSGRLFVVERYGRIRIIDRDGQLLDEPFLDLSDQVATAYVEQGLLGLAFHPDFWSNGRFFVAFTKLRTNGDTVIEEYSAAPDDPFHADAKSGRLLLSVDQPFVEHNGGTIAFGADGYLYIGLGDGGHSGDPYDNAQDRSSLLGKILRIDVDAAGVAPYAIPSGNPFAMTKRTDSPFAPAMATPAPGRKERQRARAHTGRPQAVLSDRGLSDYARPEIWALGLRNPWAFSFDSLTGDLYLPDVGQRTVEEINFEPDGSPGGANYGWDWQEGSHCYPESLRDCSRQVIGVLPIAEYKHGADGCAIIGLGVYRGKLAPELNGIYFHADWCSGKIWGLQRNEDGRWAYAELLDTALHPTGGGAGSNGEIYVAVSGEYQRYRDPFADPSGTLWRIVGADRVPAGAETAPVDSAQLATPQAAGVTAESVAGK